MRVDQELNLSREPTPRLHPQCLRSGRARRGFVLRSATLVRLVLLTVLAFALMGCSRSEHGDIIDVRDIPSPDGRYFCTVFGEIFYKTTGYPRHIYVRHAGEKRAYPGNVCIVPVGDDLAVSWTSPTNLSVRLSFETRRAVPAPANVAGVAVTFSEMTR